MKYPNCFILLIFIVIANCKNDKVEEKQLTIKTQNPNTISKSDIDNLKYVDYILSNQSLKATENWLKFKELQTEIDKWKNGDLTFFNDDIVLIKAFIKDLKKGIPEKLNYPGITTRITVVENNIYNLHSESNLNRKTKKYTLKSIKQLLVAVSNLKLQINKKLEMDSQNIQKPQ